MEVADLLQAETQKMFMLIQEQSQVVKHQVGLFLRGAVLGIHGRDHSLLHGANGRGDIGREVRAHQITFSISCCSSWKLTAPIMADSPIRVSLWVLRLRMQRWLVAR